MQELTADMFVSLDGFAAGPDGTQNWIAPYAGPDLGRLIDDVLAEPQLLILGRVTYQVLTSYWPAAADGPADQMNALPKLVFSKTLTEPHDWNNTRLATRDLGDEITALKEESAVPLRSIGSITLVREMMALGLVDWLRLIVFPAILGTTGRENIYGAFDHTSLHLAASQTLDTNSMLLDYRPIAATKTAA